MNESRDGESARDEDPVARSSSGAGRDDGSRALENALLDAPPDLLNQVDEVLRMTLIEARLFSDPDTVEQAVKIGRFAVLERVGEGATSVVYAAYDPELNRRVAIKLLRAELSTPERAARLRREAKALARVSHANVIAIHEVAEWHGRLYLAIEFVAGGTLDRWQRAAPRTWRDVLAVYVQAGRGLAATHEAGLIHRDFKPANVLVGHDGRVRVADFGLVGRSGPDMTDGALEAGGAEGPSSVERSAADSRLTASLAAVGTPAYMAPEQATGVRVDARADQFSFCVALHEALYGARPSEVRAPTSPPRLQPASVDVPSERTPLGLQRVLRRGLAHDPRARYPSMATLLADLERITNAPQRRRRLALLAVTASAVAAVAMASLRWNAERVTQARSQAHCTKAIAAAERIVGRDPTVAAALLRDAPCPDNDAGWLAAVSGTLQLPVAEGVMRGRPSRVRSVAYSPGGRYLAVAVNADVTQVWARGPDGFSRADPQSILPGGRLVRFRSAGDWVLTVSDGGTVRVWDMTRAGALLAEIPNDETVLNAHFLSEREGLVWLVSDGTLGVWQPDRGVARIELTPGSGVAPVTHLIIASDDSHVAVWDDAGSLAVFRMTWAPVAAKRLERRRGDSCQVRNAIIAPGNHLYAGCASGDVERWDIEGKSEPEIWRGHSAPVHILSIAADGRLLTAARDNTARLWTPSSPPRSELVAQDEGTIIGFSPDGRRVIELSEANVLLRELTPSRDVIVLQGSGSNPGGLPTFSWDSRRIAVTYSNGEVRVWSLDRRDAFVLHGHQGGIWSARLDPAGARLVTASWDGTVRVWDLVRRRLLCEFRGHEGHHVYTAEFDPGGERIASGAKDGTAQIWPADDCRGGALVLPGHEVWAYAVAWSPDGRMLATGSQLGAVRLWESTLGLRLWESTLGFPIMLAPSDIEGSRIHALAFSPDGGRLFAAGRNGIVRLWDLSRASAPFEYYTRSESIHSGAFSPDGRLIAVGAGATVLLLDGTSLEVVKRLDGHSDTVYHVEFSPDGRRLVTASADWTARVWRVDGGLEHTLYGHADAVATAAFDRAGQRLITGSSDGIVRVWRLDAPAAPIVLRGHTDEVRFTAFTPDGDRVVTASMDGTARVWSLPTHTDGASLRRQLRATTTACLTANQRIQQLDEPESAARYRSMDCASRRRDR